MIAQRVIKAHILVSGYMPHNVPITKDLTKNVNNSCSMYKTVVKEKKTIEENWEKWKDRILEWRNYTDNSQKVLFGRDY